MSYTLNDISDVHRFCQNVRLLAKQGALDDALKSVALSVAYVIERESSWASVFSSPELDELCLYLGKLPALARENEPDSERSVFLVTGVAGVGGHTRVLMDLVRADPGTKVTVLASNVMHRLTFQEIRKVLHSIDPSTEVEIAPQQGMGATVKWLQDRLMSLRPARTYILQHPFDAAIVAAVQPQLVGRLFYYHNCDHQLALGVHIPHATHVDFNGKGYHHCRNVEGVKNNVYWPLVAEMNKDRTDGQFMPSGKITTGTSGGLPKFDSSFLTERAPYRYEYKLILPKIMKATGGKHHHIGPLPDHVLATIKEQLKAIGADPDNFIHAPRVDDVASELVLRNIDLYVGSFPLGGGRATIEAMGAGIPLLLHDNYVSVFFTDIGEAYPGVMKWRDPNEIESIISGITPEILRDHSRRARAFYDEQHKPSHLRSALNQTLNGEPPSPPSFPEHYSNQLQRFFDVRAGLTLPQAGTSRSTSVASAKQTASRIATKHLAMVLLGRLFYKAGRLFLRR